MLFFLHQPCALLFLEIPADFLEIDALVARVVRMYDRDDRGHQPRVFGFLFDDLPGAVGGGLYAPATFYAGNERGGVIAVGEHVPDDLPGRFDSHSGVDLDPGSIAFELDNHRDLAVRQLPLHGLIVEPAALGPCHDRQECP